MLCLSLLYNKMSQLYIHIYSPSLLNLPLTPSIPPLSVSQSTWLRKHFTHLYIFFPSITAILSRLVISILTEIQNHLKSLTYPCVSYTLPS